MRQKTFSVKTCWADRSSGLRFRRVLELQEDEEDDTELSCLSEFRTKLLQGSGRAVLVEDRGACHEKRVLKVRSAQATLVHATTPPQLARNPTQARSLYGALAALHRHPHVCRVHQLVPVGDDHDDALVVVLQQFASHGSLRAMLSYLPAGALTETNARLLFQQLVMAVDYLTRKVWVYKIYASKRFTMHCANLDTHTHTLYYCILHGIDNHDTPTGNHGVYDHSRHLLFTPRRLLSASVCTPPCHHLPAHH